MCILDINFDKFSLVQAYVNGVKKLHVHTCIYFSVETPYCQLVMQGVKKMLDYVTVQADLMTPKLLAEI